MFIRVSTDVHEVPSSEKHRQTLFRGVDISALLILESCRRTKVSATRFAAATQFIPCRVTNFFFREEESRTNRDRPIRRVFGASLGRILEAEGGFDSHDDVREADPRIARSATYFFLFAREHTESGRTRDEMIIPLSLPLFLSGSE